MNIVISNHSQTPIYQQLFEQLSIQIFNGELEKGYCLPPIRQAAKELRISIITVKKAWEELERNGLIDTVAGKGCFIAGLSAEEILQKRNEMILHKMKNDISYYKSFGLTIEELFELLKRVY